jgi:hypothetical protein
MIDRAVWRELATMLYERAENPNQLSSDSDGVLLGDEAEDSAERPVKWWYEALPPRRAAF